MTSRTFTVIGCCLIGTLMLAGCSPQTGEDGGTASGDGLAIAAAFYPMQFVAEHIGGDHVDVTTLTAPGVEAHDLELSPAAVRQLGNADAVLYLSGFQAAVDSAIGSTGVHSIDAQPVLDQHSHSHEDETHGDEHVDDHGDEDHGDDDHGHSHDHSHGGIDPHFWLEPMLLAEYGHIVAAEFASLDPANAQTFTANAEEFESVLSALDTEFEEGLAHCAHTDLFVSHEAFGYLAARFGLSQHGLAGIDPEAEPSPARIREIAQAIESSEATTIFAENDVSASAMTALAADAGVTTAVLDPIEAVRDGDDYLVVMSRNLEALRTGLACD